ncbi:hypothetical protein Q31b_56420 [Novipirellula aureliae]|uniref:DUF1841 family protein n=1 Tax=Novipirellula aureliae TaxID=2527966 RepID=A0A5C6DEK9_9BACT|nr:DUF1841 family protein [Novipirellula aureliae]TWU34171.1 hypothetical protein Q31b_56420 [Novipirellula aureliae]
MARNKKPRLRRRGSSQRARTPRRDVYVESDLQFPAADAGTEGELTEDEAYEVALTMHPDLFEMQQQSVLPEEFTDSGGNVWSPEMHLQMHALIERQLSMNEPAGIRDRAAELEQRDELHPHEIRHVFAAAMATMIWEMTQEEIAFDDQRYFELIKEHYEEFLATLL